METEKLLIGGQVRMQDMVKIGVSFVAGFVAGAALLFACDRNETPEIVEPVVDVAPVMRWDHRPEAADWTRVSLAALDSHAGALVTLVPEDIDTYCPAYPQADRADRKAFWVGLLSALAKHESTWNPEAIGGGDRWFGLVQISPGTARGYGCQAQSGQELLDGSKNLSCALRIAAVTLPRDGVISTGGKGFAADWAPFLSAEKREDMSGWTSQQRYCSK